MICFPNAKINLGLQVFEKRPDSFHSISSVIVPVAWFDVLEFQQADQYSLTVYGRREVCDEQENLVTRAWQILTKHFSIPALEIHLYKSIPAGAGLGGGSSDAAFFIKEINNAFKLGMNIDEMKNHASLLGSDCPFFIENKTAIVSGRGEQMKPFELKMEGYYLFVVKPDFSVSTVDAYQNIQPKEPDSNLLEIIRQPIQFWKNNLLNDFEKIAFERYPNLAFIKNKLYEFGAKYASMTGSGSAIYGIFENEFIPPPFFKNFETRGGFLFPNK